MGDEMTDANQNKGQFPAFASALMAILRSLETEVAVYRMAHLKLRASYPDQGVAADYLDGSLTEYRTNPRLRHLIHARYQGFAAYLESLQSEPIEHQISKVSEFLQAWKLGDSKLFPIDSPLRGAK